jgi:hypothetical protein
MVLMLFARALVAADISVRMDRNPVALSESFQIAFEADASVDDEPDFSPLERDFQIISTSQSSRISIINGSSSSTKTWTLTMLARRAGRLEIPAIAFGVDRSQPGVVDVTLGAAPPPGNQAAESGEVFLEVEAQPLQPYVQQQIVYKVRLFRASPTANASLSEPQVEQGDAVMERIGEDALYDTRVNGRPYQVVERRYAIYPQSSGALKIGPLTFRGQTGLSPFSMLDPFGRRPEMIVRQSAPVDLEVRPKPEGHDMNIWLPARSLTLVQSWSGDPPTFRVGEPLTRTLTLTADGLTASQLPELPPWVPGTFKSYPDQPELSDAKSADGMVGKRVEKVAIIPNQAGEFELPAIRIPWWNTISDQLEFAELPAQRIIVLPLAAAGGTAVIPAQPAPGAEQPVAQSAAQPETGMTNVTGQAGSTSWRWVSAVLALLWFVTLLAWWQSRRPRLAQVDERALRLGQVRRDLERACRRNDAVAAKESLLRWAGMRWQQNIPRSLGEIASRCGAVLAEHLRILDMHLYGRQGGKWDGAALWQAFVAEGNADKSRPGDAGSELEPLHRI